MYTPTNALARHGVSVLNDMKGSLHEKSKALNISAKTLQNWINLDIMGNSDFALISRHSQIIISESLERNLSLAGA